MKTIKQSFSWWCFAGKGGESTELLKAARKIGYDAVELLGEELWPAAADAGLAIATSGGHGSIEHGLNRRENAARIERELRENIEKAVQWKIPTLICFSGNRAGLGDEAGLDICAETLSLVTPIAEQSGVTLAMELLNSKIDHPDYQCDHAAWGVKLVRKVNSPAFKLLYDIYHIQIMEGDIIRTIRSIHPYIAHYHTAGNPGRGPTDDTQELFYPAIYRAILATGYNGYIGHEFLPVGNPLDELQKAYQQCAESVCN